MARSIPAVRSGTLTLVADGAEVHLIPLDSPAWWEWLALDGTTRFVFEAGPLRFNAHRKQRQGESYWYTARRREGRLHEVALSTAAALTQERLEQAAARLAYPAEPVAGAPQQREDIGPSASPQPVPILATKLFIPHPRPTLVPRPRLVARLEAGLRAPVTVLASPPRAGKTPVAVAWQPEPPAGGPGPRP